jgi:SH3 domain protein
MLPPMTDQPGRRWRLALLPLLLLPAMASLGQGTRYISDDIFVVLHSGPGSDYRWRARLTPGTRLTFGRTSSDGDWAEVTTERGTSGWVKTDYLTREKPAVLLLPEVQARAEALNDSKLALEQELEALKTDRVELLNQITASESELRSVTEELTQVKQISGQSLQLDVDNRRLVQEAEDLRSTVETLEAENQRLTDKLNNEAFMNGALAVLLGVLITLAVPRLWPRRPRSSSWA